MLAAGGFAGSNVLLRRKRRDKVLGWNSLAVDQRGKTRESEQGCNSTDPINPAHALARGGVPPAEEDQRSRRAILLRSSTDQTS